MSDALDSVIITATLRARAPHAPDYQAEAQALASLARHLAERPETILQALTDLIVDMELADSAGVSIRAAENGIDLFRWQALSGAWAGHKGSVMPFDASPCGIVVSRDELLLVEHPERAFPEADFEPRIVEGLLVPFHIDGSPVGTLWILSHGSERRFDLEDARLLSVLSQFAASGYQALLAGEQSLEAKRSSEARYKALFEAIDQGFCIIEVMFDASGEAADFRFLELNSAFEAQSGLVDARGRRMREMRPDHEAFWFETYGRIARTGVPERLEHEAKALGRWFDVYAFRIDNPSKCHVAILFSDITRKRLAETEVRQKEQRFWALSTAGNQVLYRMSPDWRQMYQLEGRNILADTAETIEDWTEHYIPEDDRAEVRAAIDCAIREKTVFDLEHRVVRANGKVGWTHSRAVAILGPDGDIVEWFGAAADVTDRREALEKLRESEQRFQDFAANSADTIWIADAATRQLEYLSPAFEAMWGEPRDRIMANTGRWSELVHPEDLPNAMELFSNAASGTTQIQTYRIIRPDTGEVRWVRDTGFPIPESDGQVRRVGGISQDVTDWMRTERALAASEARSRSLVEGIPQLVWRAVDHGRWTWASPQWCEFTGQNEPDSHDWGWLAPLHPDDRDRALKSWQRTAESELLDVEYRLCHAASGRYRWFRTRATPVRSDTGELIEWLGTSTDIDQLRSLQQRQQLLLAELQHRVRNTLGIITSIARRTAESSETLEDMAAHLEGRIEAFSRVQAAVTRDPTGGVELTGLIEGELLAHAAREGRQLSIRGPQLMLNPRAAEAMSLAVHELATNAVKHGALSAPAGRISVRWSVEADDFRFGWKEYGLAQDLNPPNHEGFGFEMLLQSLPYDLGAETRAEFEPGGLRFTLVAPVESLTFEPVSTIN